MSYDVVFLVDHLSCGARLDFKEGFQLLLLISFSRVLANTQPHHRNSAAQNPFNKKMVNKELVEEEGAIVRQLEESLRTNPNDASLHLNLGVLLWEKNWLAFKEKAAEHFVISAKLDPHRGDPFRYLGHYYAHVSVDIQRALKCYQRAVTLNPDDSHAGEAMSDLLDGGGKESLEVALCREASDRSPRAFWAFRRLGYLQVHHKKWSEAVQSLQHAIRGFPSCADLWETLGLAYQRLGMFTAAIKSYGRAVELDGSRIFALVESGNIFLMLNYYRKGVEQFRQALLISPLHVSAHYGLASALYGLAKECIDSGAFRWGASLLEESAKVAIKSASLSSNLSCLWKLHADIQVLYARCLPWTKEGWGLEVDEKTFIDAIHSWETKCSVAAISARRSYQRALHLSPWQANMYTDIAIAANLCDSLKENHGGKMGTWLLSEKMCLGGLLLESDNKEFWVALGSLSDHVALKQHAYVRGLQLDVSLAVAWAYIGKLYRLQGESHLAQQAFDRARSIDPSLALPWAGMSADANARKLKPDEAYECCLRAVNILPLAEFQIGLVKLAMHSGHLPCPEVYGAIQKALQHAPYYPETHNLHGLVCEARHDYHNAVVSFRMAQYAVNLCPNKVSNRFQKDISVNLARSLCRAGIPSHAVQECEKLKSGGLLGPHGMQIHALCLWQLGKNDLALSVTRTLAANILSMEHELAAASISFICRLLYYISGLESTTASILKMPMELFRSSKISFIVSAIYAVDGSNQLESIVSSSRYFLQSTEEITEMHFLIALGKLVKHKYKDCLGIQKGIDHLRKALHMYPNSSLIRNLLCHLLLSSKEWKDLHISKRCLVVDFVDHQKERHFTSVCDIIGARSIACYTIGSCSEKFSSPPCNDKCLPESNSIQQLQKHLHQEPWNLNAKYLLVLNKVQEAREQRFPQHLCTVLERLIVVALSDHLYAKTEMSYVYRKFQLLLCAAEVSLQQRNHILCIKHVTSALLLLLPNNYLFFAHLQLCRVYAAQDDLVSLRQEYYKCFELRTDYHIGWISLKFIESRFRLQSDSTILALHFEECSKEIIKSWNMWMAVFHLVQGLIHIWAEDFVGAEESLAQACSLARDDSCILLCHGAVCMELARQHSDAQFLSLATTSLKKAKEISLVPLPIISLLLAQTEASYGSRAKWEKNLQIEWFSWPPVSRPAELYLQMHLVSKQPKDNSKSSGLGPCGRPLKWILQAIHLNPSCQRYWKILEHDMYKATYGA